MNKTEPIYQRRDVEEFLRILNDWNKNYYIAAMIGIHWGLRISDIIALEIGRFVAGTAKRIQVPNMILVTEIKTGRERHITVTPNMKKVLYAHVKRRIAQDGGVYDPASPFIVSRKHGEEGRRKPLSRQRLWEVFSLAAKRAGIRERIGTHSLRKTFAYQAWDTGEMGVDQIQKVFGHASVMTTHQYACIPNREEQKIYGLLSFGMR
jgi:integrase